MKKIIFALFAIIVLMGCNQNKDNTIQIGAILPLTGDGAQVGKLSLASINLALEDYNQNKKNDEPKIEIISEDGKLQPKTAVTAFEKLVNLNNIKIILGPIPSGSTLSIIPLANKNKTTIISTGASNNKITNAGDHIFRVELSDKDGGEEQANIAFNTLNYRKLACIYINNDYGKGLVEVFSEKFTSLGGEIISKVGFTQGNSDFRTILTKVKLEKVDAILFVFNTEIIQFVKQARELNVHTKIFTTPVFENLQYLSELGSLADNIDYIYYGNFNLSSDNIKTKEFVTKYQEKFSDSPDYYAALAFDATNLTIKALKECNYDLKKFNNQLYQTKISGVTGDLSFDKNGDIKKQIVLKTVKNSKFTNYE